MKANSNIRPQAIIDLGNGRCHYNYNIVETTDEDGQYNYDYVETGSASYGDIVSAIIREEYSLDAELALVNNYNLYLSSAKADRNETHKEEYLAFLDFRTEVKRIVKQDLAG